MKLIDSIWACKKKSSSVIRGRPNTRGFTQIEKEYYDLTSIRAPVTNTVTIRVVFTLMIITDWTANVMDVKRAFLHGLFKDDKKICMKVPEGWKYLYPKNAVLLLMKAIYGLRQAPMAF